MNYLLAQSCLDARDADATKCGWNSGQSEGRAAVTCAAVTFCGTASSSSAGRFFEPAWGQHEFTDQIWGLQIRLWKDCHFHRTCLVAHLVRVCPIAFVTGRNLAALRASRAELVGPCRPQICLPDEARHLAGCLRAGGAQTPRRFPDANNAFNRNLQQPLTSSAFAFASKRLFRWSTKGREARMI